MLHKTTFLKPLFSSTYLKKVDNSYLRIRTMHLYFGAYLDELLTEWDHFTWCELRNEHEQNKSFSKNQELTKKTRNWMRNWTEKFVIILRPKRRLFSAGLKPKFVLNFKTQIVKWILDQFTWNKVQNVAEPLRIALMFELHVNVRMPNC